MSTVGHPTTIVFGPPASVIVSPCRAAGAPSIITLVLPAGATPPPCGFGVASGQVWTSTSARQAGAPPINTVELPAPASGVP